jgi:hypothetical protein
MNIIESSARVINDMLTFDDAGVTRNAGGTGDDAAAVSRA